MILSYESSGHESELIQAMRYVMDPALVSKLETDTVSTGGSPTSEEF